MDETLTRVALDASNRPYLIWKVELRRDKLGEMDIELFKEWFQAFAQHGGLTLHVETLYGENSHHIVESCYKGLARAIAASSKASTMPSSKPSPRRQSANAPTPGSTTRSAARTRSGSAVTHTSVFSPASRAARSKALAAERRLPEP